MSAPSRFAATHEFAAVHVGLRGMIPCFGDELPSLHSAIAKRDDVFDVGMGSTTPSYEFGHH